MNYLEILFISSITGLFFGAVCYLANWLFKFTKKVFNSRGKL